MLKRLTTFVAASALAATLAFGQHRGFGNGTPPDPATAAQFRVNMLTKQLTLTPAQQQSALSIYTSAISQEQAIHASMKTAQESMHTAITSNNTGEIDRTANSLGTYHVQTLAIQGKADAAFYQLLTPDQQTKFSTMQTNRPSMGFGGGGHRGQ